MNYSTNRNLNTKEALFLKQLEAHRGILCKICRIYQDDPEDQRDLLQEIILQLWSSYETFRGESEFSSWMYRVAFNTAIVFFRKEKRRHMQQGTDMYGNLPDQLQHVQNREEQFRIFYEAVKRLDKMEKALIFLYMEGRPGKEIAGVLGITHENVRVKLNRIKEKLKYIIKIMGYEF